MVENRTDNRLLKAYTSVRAANEPPSKGGAVVQALI
jgi:hypothetical protein